MYKQQKNNRRRSCGIVVNPQAFPNACGKPDSGFPSGMTARQIHNHMISSI